MSGPYKVAWLCEALLVSRSGFYHWKERRHQPRTRQPQSSACGLASGRSSRAVARPLAVRARPRCPVAPDSAIASPGGCGPNTSLPGSARSIVTPPPIAAMAVDRAQSPSRANGATHQPSLGHRCHRHPHRPRLVVSGRRLGCPQRRVVGWTMSPPLDATLTIAALRMALRQRRPGRTLVVHSDRGSQEVSRAATAAGYVESGRRRRLSVITFFRDINNKSSFPSDAKAFSLRRFARGAHREGERLGFLPHSSFSRKVVC